MRDEPMVLSRGDRVFIEQFPNTLGVVTRVARDGSWVDVRWTTGTINGPMEWSKRQTKLSILRLVGGPS